MNTRSTLSSAPTPVLHAVLLSLALLWLAPLWMMLTYSTAPPADFYGPTILLLPSSHFQENLRTLLQHTPFTAALLNSLEISIITAVLSGTVSSMAGYALAHLRFFGARALSGTVVVMLTVPYIVVTIPQFVMMTRVFQLRNSWMGVVLPALCNPMCVLFMRQSFVVLPRELFDCARMEGVGEVAIFARIAIPLVLPALATVSIISFLQAWNGYLWPLLMLSGPDNWTAPVALGTLVGLPDRDMWGAIMAGAMLMTMPVMLLFLLLQRFIVSGIVAAGRVK